MFKIIAKEVAPESKAVHRSERFGDVKNSLADISLAKRMIGYDPQVHFEEGLKKTIEWFKKQ
jgi:nucleoside-diphosphate-sugar epimerase